MHFNHKKIKMENVPSTSQKRKNYILSLSIIGGLFFIFGFVTWLNGSLMPFLQTACELTPFQASLVTLAFYIAYCCYNEFNVCLCFFSSA